MKLPEPVRQYFDIYFTNPWNWRLTLPKKILVTGLTALLWATIIIPVAVGIYELYDRIRPIPLTIPTSHFLEVHQRIMQATKGVFCWADSEVQIGDLKRSNFSKVMQNKILAPFYRKRLPPKEEVLVPVIPEMHLSAQQKAKITKHGSLEVIKYIDLTKEQKIALNNKYGRPHNKIHGPAALVSEERVDEHFFTVHGQAQFLLHDPRGGHGCDHAIRSSICTPIFAYLYQKYHPTVNISEKEMLVAEYVTGMHDSGRSMEGTDVSDEFSAENAVSGLKALNVTDSRLLSDAYTAIADKDSNPLDPENPKPIIARLVQNADCADFTRILLKGPAQNGHGFEKSLEYLDIYKEMYALSKGDRNYVLKNGQTFGNFLEELHILMEEKNKLAFLTHQRAFREKASDPSKNYREEFLNLITFEEYPNIHYVLTTVNVLFRNPSNTQLMQHFNAAKLHWKELTEAEIHQKIKEVESFPRSLMRDETLKLFEKRLEALKKKQPSEINLEQLASQNIATFNVQQLKELRERLAKVDVSKLDERQKTHLASLYHGLIQTYLSQNLRQDVSAVLNECTQKISLSSSSPVYKLLKNPSKLPPEGRPIFLHVDTDFVRKRQLRVARKSFNDGKEVLEASFEFRSSSRKQFEILLQHLRQNPPSDVSVRDTNMQFQRREKGQFLRENPLTVSSSVVIEKEGISLEVGTNPQNGNCYQFARISCPSNTPPEKVQAFLSQIGLPLVLTSSREEDIQKEFFFKAIQFRFPSKVFGQYPRKSPEEIYQSLSETEKGLIDRDMHERKVEEVAGGYMEYTQPQLAEELWKEGGRGFVTNIIAPDVQTAATVITNVLRTDLLSTMERYQQGILGLGTCPAYNMEHGSANQAFTRLVTADFLKKFGFNDLAYGTSKIFIFYGHQAAERMPYAYPFDCGGLRNPAYQNREFKIHGFKTLKNVHGYDLQKYRLNLTDLVHRMDVSKDPVSQGNEVMFDRALGSKYIQFIMVPSKIRKPLIALLKAHGIETINGKSIEECILELGKVDDSMLQRRPHESVVQQR